MSIGGVGVAGDDDPSLAPGPTSWFQGANVQIDTRLLLPQLQNIISFVFYNLCPNTVKHLLFAWPYFREVINVSIFTRLYLRDLPSIIL